MTDNVMENHLREKIIADPNFLLEDQDVMRALVASNDQSSGGNVVDLRSIAMERLEARFDRLEDTHRHVIAAAYDNLAGTNQVHRAILRLMDATNFDDFLRDLSGDVANILRVDALRMVMESEKPADETMIAQMADVVSFVEPGFIDDYVTMGRNMPARQVTLRAFQPTDDSLYGERSAYVQSEACLKLDLGDGRMQGMLVIGSEDPQQFTPQQGTDLLTFFTEVFERVMRRWLA